ALPIWVEVAAHGVGAGDAQARLGARQRAAVAEGPDAAVLEEAADDRLDADRLRQAGDAGPQAADPADHQHDRHARLARLVEPVDHALLGQRVELGPDARGAAGARVGDLAVDVRVERLAQVERRDRQPLGLLRLDIA